MSPKAIRITYWILTVLFVLASLGDGYGGITKQQAGVDVMNHLGYPVYLMVITGVAKILGAIAILQNTYRTIKEWAFAGFVINALGAFSSRMFVGDGAKDLIPPLVFLAFTLLVYFFWKAYNRTNTAKA